MNLKLFFKKFSTMEYSRNQFLMGTDINITIFSKKNPLKDIYDGFGLFYSLEKEFSRFSKDSDLSLLNIKKEFEVSDRFLEVLKFTKEININTSNFFNPLINLKNIGYSKDFSKGVFKKENELENHDFDKISIIGNIITLKQGQNLDLGGIVKGYTVDLVSKFLKERGYNDFIINAGGDIYIYGNNKEGKTPIVGIDNPLNTDDIFASLELTNKAISTSGTYKRKWNIQDKNYHHILNPETNTNNNEIISISLISNKCYVADSYATACIAMGIEKSLIFLKEYNIDGIIIGSDGNIYQTKGMERYKLEVL